MQDLGNTHFSFTHHLDACDPPGLPARNGRDDPGDELAGLGRWWLDRQAGRIVLSGVAARFLGVGRRLPVGACLANVEPDDRAAVRALLDGPGAGAADCEFRVRTAGHGQTWLRLQAVPGAGWGMAAGILVDVTAEKRAQTRERFNFALTRYLIGTDSIDEAVDRILQLVCEELGWEWGAFWALDDGGAAGRLRCRHAWHARGSLAPFRRASADLPLAPGEGLIGQVWLDGEARWIEDASANPDLVRAAAARACGLQSAYFFPVVFTDTDGRVLRPGVLEFFSDLQRQRDAQLPGLATSISAMIGQAVARLAQQERVRQQARTDEMTGLANRSHFHAQLDARLAACARAAEPDRTFGVLFVDLDQFKPINDAFGHDAGNDVLATFAARLRALTPPGWCAGRLGGDEFALLSPPRTDGAQLEGELAAVADAVLRAARERFAYREHLLAVSASVGISVFPEHGTSTRELLHAADAAMYLSKHRGRNLATRFSGNSTLQQIEAARQLTLQSELHYAAQRGEFFLEYQPICDSGDLGVVAAEALLRWRRQDGTIVPPSVFIPVAEQSRLIVDIGRWVLTQVCRDLPRLHAAGLGGAAGLRVHVNMAAPEFVAGGLPDELIAIVADAGVDPRHICLELTESVVMEHAATSIPIMRRLRACGFEIGLDDFGMGYSSLSMLKDLPIAALKIDRSFMAGVPHEPDDNAIVRTILDLGRHRRLQVIAEGVETDAQLGFLRQFGCVLVQGWLCGRPMALDKLLELSGTAAQV
jgi:diguanylate cyclase (GGDEF)-like protein